jgi:hypothetical protein
VLNKLPAHNTAVLTGKQFFPNLISGPFHHGLIIVFSAAVALSLGGAVISLLRGKQFYYDDPGSAVTLASAQPARPTVPGDDVVGPPASAEARASTPGAPDGPSG